MAKTKTLKRRIHKSTVSGTHAAWDVQKQPPSSLSLRWRRSIPSDRNAESNKSRQAWVLELKKCNKNQFNEIIEKGTFRKGGSSSGENIHRDKNAKSAMSKHH